MHLGRDEIDPPKCMWLGALKSFNPALVMVQIQDHLTTTTKDIGTKMNLEAVMIQLFGEGRTSEDDVNSFKATLASSTSCYTFEMGAGNSHGYKGFASC